MRKILTISALALTTALAGAAIAYAKDGSRLGPDGPGVQTAFWGGDGDGDRRGEGRFGHGRGGEGERYGRHGGGPHGGPHMFKQMKAFDANNDGAVTQAEIDQFRQGQITKFDANKDGTLSLDEYQALWLEQMHSRMVDAFQRHDEDGNGQVTSEEFNERFTDLVQRLDRNGDGQLDPADRGRGGRDGGKDKPAKPPQEKEAPPAPPAPTP